LIEEGARIDVGSQREITVHAENNPIKITMPDTSSFTLDKGTVGHFNAQMQFQGIEAYNTYRLWHCSDRDAL